jgi:hypothetical protein
MNDNKEKLLNFLFTNSDDPKIKKNHLLRRRRFWLKYYPEIKYSNKPDYNDKLKELIENRPDIVDEWVRLNDKPMITTEEERKKRNLEAVKRYQNKNKPRKETLGDKLKNLSLDPSRVVPEDEDGEKENNTINEASIPDSPTNIYRIFHSDKPWTALKARNYRQHKSRLKVIKDHFKPHLESLPIDYFSIKLYVGVEKEIEKLLNEKYKKSQVNHYQSLAKLFQLYIFKQTANGTTIRTEDEEIWNSFRFARNKALELKNLDTISRFDDLNKLKNNIAPPPRDEIDNFVSFDDITRNYDRKKNNLDYYQRLLILLYIKTIPMRHDVKTLILTYTKPKPFESGNFLYVKGRNHYELFYQDTKTTKKYISINYEINHNELKNELRKHINDKKLKEGDFIFPPNVRNGASEMFKTGMKILTGKTNLTINLFRKIYITGKFQKKRSPLQISRDATELGHTVSTELNSYYLNIK